MQFITFGKIYDFKTFLKNITHATNYDGQDENDEPMYSTKRLPKLTVSACEKIHGTNAGVCMYEDDFWVQSRKNIITRESDNAGCANWVYGTEANPGTEGVFREMIQTLAEHHNIDLKTHIISVFFEWSGGSIQSKSAFTGLDKRAVVFKYFKVSPIEATVSDDESEDESARWLETTTTDGWIESQDDNIFNTMILPNWYFELDCENPSETRNEMIALVEDVIEPNSPAGKFMGVDGNIGEGAVFHTEYQGSVYKFKIKGEKHSVSKVKKPKKVDSVLEQKKQDVAEHCLPGWRLDQALQETFDTLNGGVPDKRGMGDFMRWLTTDIQKEEIDYIIDQGLIPKDIFPYVSALATPWFFGKLEEL